MSSGMIDIIVLLVLILSTIFAYSRGLVRESLAILGWIFALIISARFAYLLVPYIQSAPVIRDYMADSCELLTVASFVVLFIVVMVIVALLTPFFSDMVRNSRLGLFNSALGGIYGFARGVLIVLLVFLVYENFVRPSSAIPALDDARTYSMFAGPRENLDQALPDEEAAPDWLLGQFNTVTSHCKGSAPNV